MNSPPEAPLALRNPWEPNGRGVIEEYLDDFCLPLAEVMPERDILEYRTLAREHLRDIEDEFLAAGMSEHFARHAALREHGDPQQIGQMLVQDWLKSGKSSTKTDSRLLWFALGAVLLNLVALAFVGARFLLPLLFSPFLTGGTVGAIYAAFYPRRGTFLMTGGAFFLQSAVALAVMILMGDVSFAVFLLFFHTAVTAAFALRTARRLRARQEQRFLRIIQKA